MALFARTLHPNVKTIDDSPPKSLPYLQKTLYRSTTNILNRITLLEKSFYGSDSRKKILGETKKSVKTVKSAMKVVKLTEIVSPTHVENVIKRLSERDMFSSTNISLLKLKESYTKVLDYVPGKFVDIVNEIEKCLEYLQRYCVTFYDPQQHHYLSTCMDYELCRKNWAEIIDQNLRVVSKLPAMFSSGSLYLDIFGTSSKELAVKAESEGLLHLLIFPEVCDSMRTAAESIRAWINSDETYADFLKHDIKDLEKQKLSKVTIMRDFQTKSHQVQYQMHHLEVESRVLEKQLLNFQEKECELLVEQELLANDIGDLKLDADIKDFRLGELRKNAAVMHPDVLYETLDELTSDLRSISEILPNKEKRVEAIKLKLDWSGGKRKQLYELDKKINALKNIVKEKDDLRKKCEKEYDIVCETLAMAKFIKLLKACPDTPRKIYYNVLDTRKLFGVSKEKSGEGPTDDMETAFTVVSDNIERDWIILYLNLPFYPSRGINNIQSDIDEIDKSEVRESVKLQAGKSLQKWRRFHTRAKVDDLKAALIKIRRQDILELVEQELVPLAERFVHVEKEVFPSFMDEKLIPFYKEVERFDQLRSMGKI